MEDRLDTLKIDYSELDRPEILTVLFYPRPDTEETIDTGNRQDLTIPVEGGHTIGARFHRSGKTDPTILFFHGNGEIVSDYDDTGFLYSSLNINFLPVDYRGYGRSSGTPTITAMMRDCHGILEYAEKWLKKEGYSGSLIVMGRSLGSASAAELAAHHADRIDGLIIESGFASMEGLYRRIGGTVVIAKDKLKGLSNTDKLRGFEKPTLIIHAEYDHIIPFSAGEALYEAAGASDKTFLKVPGANHNDIFYVGGPTYLKAISALCGKAALARQ